ncbi:MAG: hypothetical protein ACOCXH_13665 [Cyclobacteriaceae bacterium]
MAYDTNELYKKAVASIKRYKLVFVQDIIAYLPCGKSAFYSHFPNESDSYKELLQMLDENRTKIKLSMRKKWQRSENATLQMGLYKLIATDEERQALTQQGSIKAELTGKDEEPLFAKFDDFMDSCLKLAQSPPDDPNKKHVEPKQPFNLNP